MFHVEHNGLQWRAMFGTRRQTPRVERGSNILVVAPPPLRAYSLRVATSTIGLANCSTWNIGERAFKKDLPDSAP